MTRNSPLPSVPRSRVADSLVQRALDGIYAPLAAVVAFLQPFVTPEPWQQAAMLPGWTNKDNFAASKKDPVGRVHLRGYVGRASGATTGILVLPVAHRPKHEVDVVVYSAGALGQVNILPSGLVSYLAGTVTDISLENVSFDVEA